MKLPWWASALAFIGMFTIGPTVAWFALFLVTSLFGLSFLWNDDSRDEKEPAPPDGGATHRNQEVPGNRGGGQAMTYEAWQARPAAENNAEAATVVMGWRKWEDGLGYSEWQDAAGESHRLCYMFSPCTDRNATDIVLAEVSRRGLETVHAFIKALLTVSEEDRAPADDVPARFEFLRASPSLLTWAAVEACREGGGA